MKSSFPLAFAIVALFAEPVDADAGAPRAFRWELVRNRLNLPAENIDVSAADKGTVPAIAPRSCAFELLRPSAGTEQLSVSCVRPGGDRVAAALWCTPKSTTGVATLFVGAGATLESFTLGCAK